VGNRNTLLSDIAKGLMNFDSLASIWLIARRKSGFAGFSERPAMTIR
jgi:hypothetical protein